MNCEILEYYIYIFVQCTIFQHTYCVTNHLGGVLLKPINLSLIPLATSLLATSSKRIGGEGQREGTLDPLLHCGLKKR